MVVVAAALSAGGVGAALALFLFYLLLLFLLLFGHLDGAAADIECASRIAGDDGDLAGGELDRVGVDDAARHALEARADDGHELAVVVAGEGDGAEAEAAADLVAERAFGQVHGVGDGEDDQAAVAQLWPVEEVVHDLLVLGDELVEFVHEDHAGDAARARVGELVL